MGDVEGEAEAQDDPDDDGEDGAGSDGLVLLFNAGAEVVDHGDDAKEQAQGQDVADDVDEDLAQSAMCPWWVR